MGRSPCCSKEEGLNRGAWTALEDRILKDYIKAHGEGKWRSIPKKAGLKRCGKSCRLRWLNYLRPDIKRGNITPDEEDLIIRLHKLLGNRWSLIAGRLPGRTDNEIKNYWNSTLAKREKGNNSNQSRKEITKRKKTATISVDRNTPKGYEELAARKEPQTESSSDDTVISGQSRNNNNGVSSTSEDQGLSAIMDTSVGVMSCSDDIDMYMILENDSDYYFKKFSDLDVNNYMTWLLVEVNNDGDRAGGGGNAGFMVEEDWGGTTDCIQQSQGDMNNLHFGSLSSTLQSADQDWIV